MFVDPLLSRMEFTAEQILLAEATVIEEGYLHLWELDGDDALEVGTEYMLRILYNSWFVGSFFFEYTDRGRVGVLGAYSTGRSTRLEFENRGMAPGRSEPHWVEFDVWYHVGCCLGDMAGIRDLPSEYKGTLGQFLANVCPAWRIQFPQQYGQLYYDTLRGILHEGLRVAAWAEVFAGRSILALNALDVYWKTRPAEEETYAARWLLNTSTPPRYRWNPSPDQWWCCPDWVSAGRREQSYFDWPLEPVVADMVSMRGVSFRPVNPMMLEAIRRGILAQPMPGVPLPFLTEADVEAYWRVKGKGKGKGKGKLSLM